ncbi:choice-of-anchor J domain-containing protein [Flavobacterium sp. HSC-61S13]|uniref:choice-of-anchor J domain-containing protein n=1 Tax=Flavobacterium sp. HSC-61S13 TaxID=2910963 RepID=UPI0020A1BABF|nr:choice-of-anchor J domain-containing protein [Flavobacterium sp. HSC-61S13]MCP1995104.1 gliding motility-associated-like protein [Flavobacterium sp. HSC-61S13]
MKKITFFFSTFFFAILFLVNGFTYARGEDRDITVSNINWQDKSYAPELYLQPYFNLTGLDMAAAAAACTAQVLPFSEGFNKNSTTLSCWTIVDANKDETTAANIWRASSTFLEGDQSMYFYGLTGKTHNDWLISPDIKLDASKTYRLKYNYRTTSTSTYVNELEVLMSSSGIATADFTKTIVPKKVYPNTVDWQEERVIFTGVTGDVNLAWHVVSTGVTYFYIDSVVIEEVATCPEPLQGTVREIRSDKVTLAWEDNFSATSWEYYIQKPAKGVPTANGTVTSSKTATVATKEGSGANLVASTAYEYYVRTVCSDGQYSIWNGPFKFTTPCANATLPFFETYNTDSTTLKCWSIIDANKDSTSPTGSNIWRLNEYSAFEGSHMMYFYGGPKNDDWLISTTFKLDATKIYKLKYMYKTTTSYINEFEVLASNTGADLSAFTKTIIPKRNYSSGDWVEETAFITNYGGDVNLAWHVTTQTYSYVYLDNVSLSEVECVEPLELGVKEVKTDEATILWKDPFATSWEYYLEGTGGTGPVGAGTATTKTEAKVIVDHNNKNLVQNTAYDLYVRSKCANGKFGEWSGPFTFNTACNPVAVPFTEGFNTSSTTFNCWTILDGNKDATSPTGNNIFKRYASTPQEGDRAIYFYGSTSTTTHDDWLISPTIKMNGEIYAITYYYKTSGSYDNEFEVALSKNGTNPTSFTTILEGRTKRNAVNYVKKTLYVRDIIGDVNIGWHMVAKGYAYLYLDAISIEKVDCIAPQDNLVVSALEKDKATVTWTDTNSSSWEFFVQAAGSGPAPVGSGSIAKVPTASFSKTSGSGGANLQPNTEYEFFVRGTCAPGKNSSWVGPIKFKTPCDSSVLPFWEGFNTNSNTAGCWTIIDNNKDSSTASSNIWYLYNYSMFEGDRGMYFYGGSSTTKNDDWLISPSFKLDATKYYRLKYHYKTTTSYKNDFEVLLSNKGTAVTDFTTTLLDKKGQSSSVFAEDKAIIGGIGGNVNIAWRVTTDKSYTYVYVDNVFVEEIIGCPEPMSLNVKNEKETSVTIEWSDAFGKEWEYVVQPAGGKAPTAKGTVTKTKENVITQDQSGKALTANTEYEFYVRTVCGTEGHSIWEGPFKFKTACGLFTTPFWEGFNADSQSLGCWTIIDENKDSTSPTGSNIWRPYNYGQYEGSQMMYFYGYQSEKTKMPHNDWLISPRVKFDANKIYRLKYHYKVTTTTSYDYEFEVVLSNSGTDTKKFTKVVVPKKKYDPSSEWMEEYVYITGTSGEVNIAWHVSAETTGTYLYVDNVFIEEVTGCPEPLKPNVKDIQPRKASLTWEDAFGATSWEYYVQKKGKGIPVAGGTATTKKDNPITQEQSGIGLEPNTDYEYYVRTVCGTGGHSIWRGPFVFATACDVYASPFWEGFNTDSETTRCWTIVDRKGSIIPAGTTWRATTSTYEGNQAMYFYLYDANKEPFNDWFISPTVNLDGGMYILKYHYKTTSTTSYNNDFEVKLSTQGADITKFSTVLIPMKNPRLVNYVEDVAFINNIKGDVNIGWHIKAENTNAAYLYLDNITLKKVETCPEPYYLKSTNPTTTSVDVEWQQDGGVTSWEAIVVNYGEDAKANPIKTVAVTTNPKTTISGLDSGKGYTVYVRANCIDGKSNSDWSTPINVGTKVGANDDCSGAINIPVNVGLDCVKTVSGSLFSATRSATIATPPVFPLPTCSPNIVNDVWFEFTATSSVHLLTLKDLISISGATTYPYVYGALYDQPCASITATSLGCFSFYPGEENAIFSKLTPGKKYYFRLGVQATYSPSDYIFKLCITTSEFTALEVSPSGQDYTVEELVKDVLVKSNCDLVSNVKYQNGDGSAKAMSYNTLGYFNKSGSNFPFKEGIVLGTNEMQYIPGPYTGYYNANRGANNERWDGDKDINDAIKDAGGGPYPKKRVTQIEFDFIPIKEEIKFEYLFASNSYHNLCGEVCNVGAMFAAWLVDSTTDEGKNLAKVTGTDLPIAINTIRDASKSGVTCGSANEEYFWKYYDGNKDNPIDASVDFAGLTKAMSSETVKVVPGRKYHIKLAVIDFCPTGSHTSAVFFNAGSFDLGNLDLGADMLVDNGNALCNGESRTIKSGLGTEDITIKWYKDDVLIAGANTPELEVFETGKYKVVGKYGAINCEVMGDIKIEIYPIISSVVAQPKPLPICRTALNVLNLDLTQVEEAMLAKVDPAHYKMIYYKSKEDAEAGIGSIADPTTYSVETTGVDILLYIYVEDLRTGCSEIFEWTLRATKGTVPEARENVKICAAYTLPALEAGQHYYAESAAKGVAYKVGDVLTEPKEHTIYVLQDNGGGCYEEISFKVTITAAVKADVFGDVELECALHPLAALSAHNKYFTQAGGQGIELAVGSLIPHAQTVYVYAASEDGLCVDESSFKVSYLDCPIQKGISPNGDGKNDRFDLSKHGVNSIVIYNRYGAEVFAFQGAYTDQWYGQDKGGKSLPDGTYYYVVIAHGKTKTGWVQINK